MSHQTELMTDTVLGGRILKVNHAGEHGAVCIYAGQLLTARWTATDLVAELAEFKSHEERHRAIFLAELERRGVCRCRSYFFCGISGFVLGVVTGLFGRHAIFATTVAVERVVLMHLAEQLKELTGHDIAATAAITAIYDEEKEHHDRSASHMMSGSLWSKLLAPVVSCSTEAVIWMGMRG